MLFDRKRVSKISNLQNDIKIKRSKELTDGKCPEDGCGCEKCYARNIGTHRVQTKNEHARDHHSHVAGGQCSQIHVVG